MSRSTIWRSLNLAKGLYGPKPPGAVSALLCRNSWQRALTHRWNPASNFSIPPDGDAGEVMNNNPARGPLRVPGFGRPVDFEHSCNEHWKESTFTNYPHGFSSWTEWRTTLKELAMLQLVNSITDKPNWHRKVFDPTIMQKWKAEAMNLQDGHFTERTWQYCAEELTRKAHIFEKQKFVKIFDTGQTVVKADRELVTDDLQQRLKRAVQPLLNQPSDKQDWHPGTDGKVLNLVHPSMYPFVYGRSRIVSEASVSLAQCFNPDKSSQVSPVTDLEDINDDLEREESYGGRRELWSNQFQWLPSDVEFNSHASKQAKIVTYINGLHPEKHQELYAVIEEFIGTALPLWNAVLSHSGGLRVFQNVFRSDVEDPAPPYWLLDAWEKADAQSRLTLKQKVKDYLAQPEDQHYYRVPGRTPMPDIDIDTLDIDWVNTNESEVKGISYDMLMEKHYRIRKYPQPEPDAQVYLENWASRHFPTPPSSPIEDHPDGLQVMVKLSSIELAPDKPAYEGGDWHLEGKLNEHIVATAIYYYDVANITQSHIKFRKEATLDSREIDYDHGDHGFVEDIYGVCNIHAGSDTPAVQDVGKVATKDGRMLVFPNTLQHRVEPFELEDPTKPGHRRFLVLWLVDPNYRILSTRNVPPQQEDWWRERLAKEGKLSSEWNDHTADEVERLTGIRTMGRGEAEAIRLELMKERTKVMESVEQNYDTYNFCEH